MKEKRVLRYYCEFCKKSGGNKWRLAKHEKHCTNNPDRDCGMCGAQGLVQELIAAAKICQEDNLKPLRDVAENCPACILAGIRQSGRQKPPESMDDVGFYFVFDFKSERDQWWLKNAPEINYV